jgi:hypothetical protein
MGVETGSHDKFKHTGEKVYSNTTAPRRAINHKTPRYQYLLALLKNELLKESHRVLCADLVVPTLSIFVHYRSASTTPITSD